MTETVGPARWTCRAGFGRIRTYRLPRITYRLARITHDRVASDTSAQYRTLRERRVEGFANIRSLASLESKDRHVLFHPCDVVADVNAHLDVRKPAVRCGERDGLPEHVAQQQTAFTEPVAQHRDVSTTESDTKRSPTGEQPGGRVTDFALGVVDDGPGDGRDAAPSGVTSMRMRPLPRSTRRDCPGCGYLGRRDDARSTAGSPKGNLQVCLKRKSAGTRS